jgi:hypothetical protein
LDEATFVALQHQMAQQAAFAQIPDVVKRVRIFVEFMELLKCDLSASLSSIFIRLSWKTTFMKSVLLMRAVGTS